MSSPLPAPISVVGLGYVGLPLALAFARNVDTIAFDISPQRVSELIEGYDRNGEHAADVLSLPKLTYTADPEELAAARFHIVAVPTPVDSARRPDTSHLVEASCIVGRAMRAHASNGPIYVVFESTVYPGCTEEVCLPVLEAESGLRCGEGFHLGYSPERINPGDAEHTLDRIIKVVAARDPEALEMVARVYATVALAGVHRAPDIRTAEAAKVIENIQRDLNIALMNELSMLFNRMGLNTRDVLAAARTKWNFLPFEPGLVGGHCIPVDPYYLTYKAQEIGYHPKVVLAGRRTNDGMGVYIAHEVVRLLIQAGRTVRSAKVLVLGMTFKEDVRDLRNSRVTDLVAELERYGVDVRAHDPLAAAEAIAGMGIKPQSSPFAEGPEWDAVVLAVPHRSFRERPVEDYLGLFRPGGPAVLVDLRGALRSARALGEGILYWAL